MLWAKWMVVGHLSKFHNSSRRGNCSFNTVWFIGSLILIDRSGRVVPPLSGVDGADSPVNDMTSADGTERTAGVSGSALPMTHFL